MTMKSSKYHGVYLISNVNGPASLKRAANARAWIASIHVGARSLIKQFATEREAAICVDRWILEHQLDKPLNILKPKP